MNNEKTAGFDGGVVERQSVYQLLFAAFTVLVCVFYVVGGIYSGYRFVVRVRALAQPPQVLASDTPPQIIEVPGDRDLSAFDLTATPEALANLSPVSSATATIAFTPIPTPTPDPLGTWNGKDRVNILLLGMDHRPDEGTLSTRTDSLLIITIDPRTKTAGMLSIPRDLWVPIPTDDRRYASEDRINTAYFWGDWLKQPGGGPALAKKTVQYNFGVRIHYYARVDFVGFRDLVDALDGIDVDVPEALYDNAYPTDDYGYMTVNIPKGMQHFTGERALQYARSRHQDSDFGRMKRQQLVLLAMRKKALSWDVLPKLPALAWQCKDLVQTDMSVQDALALVNIGKDIDPSRFINRSIDGPAVYSMRTVLGADVLIPVRKEIEKIVSEVFFDSRLREEDARVEIVNSSGIPALASMTVSLLESRGFTGVVTGTLPADSSSYEGISVVNYSNKSYTVDQLVKILGIPSGEVEARREPTSAVDVRVILGKGARLP